MSVKRCHRLLLGLMVATGLCSAPAAFAQESAEVGAHRFVLVQNDLEETMRKESLDAAKYALFAQKARERGNQELAAVFERVASTEKSEHLQKLAAFAGSEVSADPAEQQEELARFADTSDAANLREAMTAERFQANALRSDMVNRAIKYGDIQAAELFLNLGNREIDNLLELRSAKKLVRQSQS